MAGALLLPRGEFSRDVPRLGWSIVALGSRHPNASAQMIATRLVQVRDAVATVIDGNRITTRVVSPWLGQPAPASAKELQLAAVSLDAREEVREGDCWATPVVDGEHRRVIVLRAV